MSAQAYDLLLSRATLALVAAKAAGSPWSEAERREPSDDPEAPKAMFILREGVELTDAQLAAMYPPPPPDDDEAPEVEAAEPAKPKKAKAKPKKGGA